MRADTCAGRLCILSFPFCLLRCLATAALSGSCHRHSVQTGGGSGRCTERRHFSGSGLTVVRGRAFEVPWYALRTRLVSHSTFFRGSTNLTPCGRPAPAVNTAHSDRADRGSQSHRQRRSGLKMGGSEEKQGEPARTPRFALAKIKASPRVVPAPNSGVGGCRTKALTSSAGGGGGEGAAAGRGLLSLSGTAAKQQGDGASGRETNSLTAAVAVTTKAAEAQAGRCEDSIAFEAGGVGEVSQTSSACSQDAADASGKFLHPGRAKRVSTSTSLAQSHPCDISVYVCVRAIQMVRACAAPDSCLLAPSRFHAKRDFRRSFFLRPQDSSLGPAVSSPRIYLSGESCWCCDPL